LINLLSGVKFSQKISGEVSEERGERANLFKADAYACHLSLVNFP